MTTKERFLLKKLLSFDVSRYLMANSCQRLDGVEKAERHIKIATTIYEYIKCKMLLDGNFAEMMIIHDFIGEKLTDRMDEVIGFPINEELYGSDYDELHRKFIRTIFSLMPEMIKLIS